MSQELKYKIGDRVTVFDLPGDLYDGEVGVIDELDLDDTAFPYLVRFNDDDGWYEEAALTRAASSPDEQDIENAGGSEFVPSFFVGDKVRHKDGGFDGVGTVSAVVQSYIKEPYTVRVAEKSPTLYCAGDDLELAQPEQAATRDATLDRAKALINGDRHRDYGDASENFQRIADLWKPILGKDVTAVDVSLCLLQLKVARIITSNGHEDSWIDAAGYVALGSEIAAK